MSFINYIRKRIQDKNFLYLLSTDIFLVLLSFYLSVIFKFDFTIPNELYMLINYEMIIAGACLKILCFRLFGIYRGMWRFTSVWDMFNIIKANIFATFLIVIIIRYSIGFNIFSRSIFIIDLALCLGFISISRLGIRLFFTHVLTMFNTKGNEKIKKKKILLIGAGYTGLAILRQIQQKPNYPIEIVGFMDDDDSKIGKKIHGFPIFGAIDDLKNIKVYFDEIYICVPSATKNQMRRIVDTCKALDRPFKTLPSISEMIEGKVSINQFREVSILDLLGREEIILDKNSINQFIKGKRVLITGSGGSIGSELVRQCIKFQPAILIMMEISELNLFKLDRELNLGNSSILIKSILSDVRDPVIVNQIFDEYRPQVVFHAAAYKHVPIQESFPWEAVKTNIFGTSNVAKSASKYAVEKFVLVSTDKAVRPTNVMGATKRLAEFVVQNFNLGNAKTEYMSVRFGNVLGSSGSVIPIFKEQIKMGGPVTVTDPEMKRYFMSIPEASQLILQAGSLGNGGEVFILDMGRPMRILDIANELIRLSGYEPNIDIQIEFTGSRPGEKKIEELSLPNENLDKTKHEKILVFKDSNIKNESFAKIILAIESLEHDIFGKSADQVRVLLSSILSEYKPDLKHNNPYFIGTDAKA
jgi:FlaA1/EpsC-like NDP-sugar epimerase